MFSHSRVNTHKQCPFKYKMRYIDRVLTVFNQDPANPLILGTAMHLGIEKSAEEALNYYNAQYAVISDLHVNEMIKLEIMIGKARDFLQDYRADATFELEIRIDDYIGFADMLIDNNDGTYDLLDFKYSSNVENYKKSDQLDVYQYYLELMGYHIKHAGYVIIPKTFARQKNDEDLYKFRQRIMKECSSKKIMLLQHEYNYDNVLSFLEDRDMMELDKDFKKCMDMESCVYGNKFCTRCGQKSSCKLYLCKWCEYKEYCEKGENYMLLPENKRTQAKPNLTPDMWIYAQSYVGKTTFMDQFDNNLFLNTDGNTDNVTSPVLRIKDTYDGRIKKWAWINFVETIDELEKKENTFEVITIDLLEDLLEYCRAYIFNREGWKHESDGGFGKGWDMVKTEFLNQIKRLKNCGYRIAFISKEIVDEVTLKNGTKITKFKPNIRDSIANVITGTVDVTMRAYADGDERFLSFKNDEYVFGGGRINFIKKEIPLSKKEFDKVLRESQQTNKPEEPEPAEEESKKRTRKRRE